MSNSLRLVFSNYSYSILAGIIFAGLLLPLLFISEFLFFEPYVIFHVSDGSLLGFLLIIAVSIMGGIVLSMNVFRIRALRNKTRKIGGGVLGSVIGASAGACSCGPIGFAVISTFGSVGGAATAFLTNYEIPLRLVALGILGITYYTTVKSIKTECKIQQ